MNYFGKEVIQKLSCKLWFSLENWEILISYSILCQIINKERSNKNKVIEEASTTKVVVPFAMKILTIKMQLLTVKSTVGQIFTPIV